MFHRSSMTTPKKVTNGNDVEQWIKYKKRLAVLCGGQSTEHEISLRSSITVLKSIDRNDYDVTLIGVDKQGHWTLCDEDDYLINPDDAAQISLAPAKRYLAIVPGRNDAQLIDASSGETLEPIHIAFSLLHGGPGEDGSVQGMLRLLNIPIVGSDVLGSAICMDKDMTKRILRDAGLAVTPWITLHRATANVSDFDNIRAKLGLPLFIKPAGQGSSIGVSKVKDKAGFEKALALAFSFDHKVLVETAIIGREIETAILGNDQPEVSVCGEILVENDFYGYENKYVSGSLSTVVIPAHLELGVSDELRRIAREAFRVVGCEVMARVDFFLTWQGQIIINEINSLPGFTSSSLYLKLWEGSDLDCSRLVNKLISLAMERAQKMGTLKSERLNGMK